MDGCEKYDRYFILSLLDHVLKARSPQAKVKVYATSQKMNDMEDSLKLALAFDIEPQRIRKDVVNYVSRRSMQLCDKFGFAPEN